MSCQPDRHPPWTAAHRPRALGVLLLAVFAVVGTFGAAHSQPGRRPVDAVAIALVLVGPASLLLVHRWPRAVVSLVSLVTLGYLLAGYAYGPVVITLVITVVVTVSAGHRLTAWLAVAAVVVGDFALRWLVLDEPRSGAELMGVTAWALVALALAELVRVRREWATSWRQARDETRRRQAGEERLRIAQELHDVVAHHMSLINVQASVALHLAEKTSEPVEPALRAIKAASKEALTEMRALVGVLRDEDAPAPRAPAATLAALDELVERSRYAGLEVQRHVEGQERPLPAAVELAAFRITQEAITNVVRHSGARRADIRLRYDPEQLVVCVEDDGCGVPDQTDLLPGNGLRGMRERAEAMGGWFDLGRAPRGGLRLRAVLPTEVAG